MIKKIFVSLLMGLSVALYSGACFAAGTEFGNITFNDAEGNIITESTDETVTAKVHCINNSGSSVNPVLLVCEYEDDMLKAVWYENALIEAGNEGDVTVEFNPTGNGEVKATLLDSLKNLNSYMQSATMLNDSTDLCGISVNGVRVADYSDDVDSYLVKYEGSGADIVAEPADGGSVAEVGEAERLPGIVNVKVTTPYGTQRDIELVLYKNDYDLYSVQNFKYEIDGTEYEVPNFDPAVTEYEIELPDNTFYVTMKPEAMSVSETTMQVKDINHSTRTYGENNVAYVSGSYSVNLTARHSIGGLVPIKNEETHGLVTTKYGENSKSYTFKFKSKQPRLTEFNMVGAAEDKYRPAFVSGAAMNNDNGTTTGTDRAWSFAYISKKLIGGSMFMMDLASNRSNTSGNTWFIGKTSGEYFNFTADTPGTIYFIAANAITNSEFTNNGWTYVRNSTPARPAGYSDWYHVPKTWNDYDENQIFMMRYEWSNAAERFKESGLGYTTGTSGMISFGAVYKKDFEANENVSVYHLGKGTNSTCPMTAVIVWDIQ